MLLVGSTALLLQLQHGEKIVAFEGGWEAQQERRSLCEPVDLASRGTKAPAMEHDAATGVTRQLDMDEVGLE